MKQALAEGRPQLGLVLGFADPTCADLVGGAGFDWLLIDGEHSAAEPANVLQRLQVLAGHPAAVAFRPGGGEPPASLTRWLDLGVRNLVVPMVEDASQAAGWVAATRYPPVGRRGVGTALSRAAGWGRDRAPLAAADAGICVIAQIESPAGVEAAEAIARVDGIDALLVGPSDLAATCGHPGNPAHPDVRARITAVLARGRAAGKPVGLFVPDPPAAARALADGFRLLVVGTDTGWFARAVDDHLAGFRAAVTSAATAATSSPPTPPTAPKSPATR